MKKFLVWLSVGAVVIVFPAIVAILPATLCWAFLRYAVIVYPVSWLACLAAFYVGIFLVAFFKGDIGRCWKSMYDHYIEISLTPREKLIRDLKRHLGHKA